MKDSEKMQIVADLIAIKNVNDNEEQVADYLQKLFKKNGIQAEKVVQFPGRANLVAEISGAKPGRKIGLCGHFDTVSPGDETSWDTPPFEATMEDNRLYGLGASDMKAGIAQLAIALIELKQAGLPHAGTVRFLGTISEELTAEGGKHLAEAGYVDDLDVVLFAEPTGVPTEELTGYFASGAARINPETLSKLKNAAVNHPAPEQHFIFKSHKGWMTYTVMAHGKAAHSSMPGMGISAVDCLIQYYLAEKEMYANFTESSDELGKTIFAPDIFRGGNQVNSIPDRAFERVKVRTIPELPNHELVKRLQALIDDLNQQPDMDLTLTIDRSEVPVQNHGPLEFTNTLQQHARQTLNEPLDLPTISVSLGTDASEFRLRNEHAEMIILGPGNTTSHQPNEYVSIQAYLNMGALLIAAISSYLNPEKTPTS